MCKECNIELYLINLQRVQLCRLLKIIEINKNKHTIEYLGCDIVFFKKFIEKKMIEGMNWYNIHLDHIKPVSKFNLENNEEFIFCCHYTNFQPLLINDNLSKYNKWSIKDEIFWNVNIKGKEFYSLYYPS
jgi:hypothetical protein